MIEKPSRELMVCFVSLLVGLLAGYVSTAFEPASWEGLRNVLIMYNILLVFFIIFWHFGEEI